MNLKLFLSFLVNILMALSVGGFVYATISLSCIYFCLAALGGQKLIWLHGKSRELNTRKLFVMSCFLTCILRCMSFFSISLFYLGKISVKSSEGNRNNYNSNEDEDFFNKAAVVLFDFPDFPCISAYMLLALLWAEAFFQVTLTILLNKKSSNIFFLNIWKSRVHWLSSVYYRRTWMLSYLILY